MPCTTHGNNCDGGCKDPNADNGMMTKVWGPPGWLFLHCVTFGYPYVIIPSKKEHQEKVINTGYLDNTTLAYNSMDIFCLPSWREGMPYTVLEAMMSGLPVVATDIRGCREVVIHNKTGLICKPKDKISLYNSLKYLLDNPNKRINYGKSGYLRARDNYDSEVIKKNEITVRNPLCRQFIHSSSGI